MAQPAYKLAANICIANLHNLPRNVHQCFTERIIHGTQAEDFEEVVEWHSVIKRINSDCPELLHDLIPQLERELEVKETRIRVLATQVLGEMFSDTGTSQELEQIYPSVWVSWLQKKDDRVQQVRLAFVEGCKGLLMHHRANLREAVEGFYECKDDNNDEAVTDVCFRTIDYQAL